MSVPQVKDITKFDANRTSVLSGFEITCPDGARAKIIPNLRGTIEVCKGVKLIAPDGHDILIQDNLIP